MNLLVFKSYCPILSTKSPVDRVPVREFLWATELVTRYYGISEQYKDDQGTGPPGGPGDKDDDKETIWDKIANFFGSIVDGIAGIFEAILGKLLDALTALSEMLMGKVKDVVEVVLSVLDEVPKLFGGFLDFLALIFPFLPPEITLLLTFGVIAVVFIGIIKAIRR